MTIAEFDSLDIDTRNQLFDWFKMCAKGTLFSDFLADYKIKEDGAIHFEKTDCVVIHPNAENNDWDEATKNDTFNFPHTKEEHVSGKDRYSEGAVETIVYIESMMKAWEKNDIPADVAYNLGQVLRYLSSRLGVKDDVKVELGKAHNYLYRAINGKWFED